MLARGSPSLAVEGLNNFVVSPAELAISQAARYYIYGKARVSKETFDDPEFRGLLQSYYVAGGGKGTAPFLTRQGLLAFVEAEYNVFKCFAQATLKQLLESSDGNAPMQGLHDCATLKNHHKCLATGVEFVDPDMNKNHVLAVALVPISGGTDVIAAAKLDEVFEDVFGMKYHEVCNSTISDKAAAGVASQFGQEGDTCDMHDVDKVGRAMCGDLTRSRNKVIVNPFPEGQALMAKLKAAAGYFSYSTRFNQLAGFCDLVPGGVAKVRPQVDLNTTRVSARRRLVHSMVRLHKALDLYQAAHMSSWALSAHDWDVAAEFLALFDISGEVATLVQTEKLFTSALGLPLKERMMSRLRADVISVVDLPKVLTPAHAHHSALLAMVVLPSVLIGFIQPCSTGCEQAS
jgi:hypothetical protein